MKTDPPRGTIPPPSPARETEHVAALDEWCDCTDCLRAATVVDIETARLRALGREIEQAEAEPLFLGEFRGQVPQADDWATVRFWTVQLVGWALLALVAWWAVRS
jgi:hypothetical protein